MSNSQFYVPNGIEYPAWSAFRTIYAPHKLCLDGRAGFAEPVASPQKFGRSIVLRWSVLRCQEPLECLIRVIAERGIRQHLYQESKDFVILSSRHAHCRPLQHCQGACTPCAESHILSSFANKLTLGGGWRHSWSNLHDVRQDAGVKVLHAPRLVHRRGGVSKAEPRARQAVHRGGHLRQPQRVLGAQRCGRMPCSNSSDGFGQLRDLIPHKNLVLFCRPPECRLVICEASQLH